MNKWLVSVSIVLAMVVSNAQAAGDAAAGKAKSGTCLACHGADGNSANAVWPKLAGQHPSYIKKQLQEFKAGARKNDLMSPMAMPLSDQDMDDLAAYFSGQAQSPGVAAADQVELGTKIYRAGNVATNVAACMACHGPSGNGNPGAKFPRISGQHAAYLEKTLKDFRSGDRANDNAKMMQNVVNRMTDKEIAAVAQYLQGLR
ncbi:c-type cytochrome [Sedimenticola selenatireducens]|uniref:Cytochrome c4 n=1 Tax=Sedimenticola selenatireducens TaxID=191960 RepID=A0A558DUP2_9GAMM|nr:c-type cytochrome [Sedimenticola selenatireducens]TVO72512.1 cytochrome c4 [Sedimenticola selenatireducens]TVT64767.1 MAG: cytochrome c4 [Sedimenticola selenatireducens]